LVIETSLYYDARSEKHQIMPFLICEQQGIFKLNLMWPRIFVYTTFTQIFAEVHFTLHYRLLWITLKCSNSVWIRNTGTNSHPVVNAWWDYHFIGRREWLPLDGISKHCAANSWQPLACQLIMIRETS